MSQYLELFEMIGVLARKRYLAAERSFATIGLNHTEARLLYLLDQAGGSAAQDELSNRLFIDRTNAGRALKRLEQERYITRSKAKTDRRAYTVAITEKGRTAVADILRLRDTMVATFFRELSEDEAGQVVMLLNKALSPKEDDAIG